MLETIVKLQNDSGMLSGYETMITLIAFLHGWSWIYYYGYFYVKIKQVSVVIENNLFLWKKKN